jgi:hypothetical protein
MNRTRKLALAAVLASALGVAACGGGGADVQQNISSVSQGQQLSDLKRALDEGAINQQEYDRLRAKIMRSY